MQLSCSWILCLTLLFCSCQADPPMNTDQSPPIAADSIPDSHQVLTLGAGCFWCIEAAYARIDGVESATSGYMGGTTVNPSYKDICTGNSGHAEVVRVVFDPEKVTAETILRFFFQLHDPTQLNRQGNDISTQYRSAIFYHTEEQQETAANLIAELTTKEEFSAPIVTEVTAAETFYPAEDYHQDYWETERGQNTPYCRLTIPEKLEKLGLSSAPLELPATTDSSSTKAEE